MCSLIICYNDMGYSVMRYNMVNFFLRTLPLMAAGLLLVGCGGTHEASVSGTVTMDGKPLVGGHVTFHAVGAGATAYGRTMEDGSYQLQTGRETGLRPGDYRVTVVSTTTPDPGDDEEIGELLTPPRYNDPQRSGLRFTVEPGRNRIDLTLHTSPPDTQEPA